ncbi:hypothetical protein NCER_101931 [Vairimorpha ceranae BRL01]|uniref:Uncharacterized protein n=2 Tax=Vairimorpha ceranae TaxID=40302 RepID=C4VB18_VAIC1|nr:hypothetical protein AAJ76_420006123 [Vairimorpha ceranae]EEQ81585.1 hypothetical protein NCER_101931 [Vairimorpha ceranae BRL01]KAF5139946.1 hypothetical protein G9O61_00g018660 [Vairimorpha ceranae]KKO74842.1 hypothetical protein AAJ76_420006123 [Vairimorpha ceranae]
MLSNLMSITCIPLFITILYEIEVKPELEYLYKDIIIALFDKYNVYLKPVGIKLVLEDALPYSLYSQDADYKDLIKFSGTDNLSGMMSVLVNKQKNILLIASTQVDQSDVYFNLKNPCASKYITTFNKSNSLELDTISSIYGAIERYLGELMSTKIPKTLGIVNLGDAQNFSQNLINNGFIDRVQNCSGRNKILSNKEDLFEQFKDIGEKIPENLEDLPTTDQDSISNKIIGKEENFVINDTRETFQPEKSTLKREKVPGGKNSKPKRFKKSKSLQYLNRPKKNKI